MQYKAVARLFWTGGREGARWALSRVPKTRALWGGVGGGGGGGGVGEFSNLDAPKRYFQHLS